LSSVFTAGDAGRDRQKHGVEFSKTNNNTKYICIMCRAVRYLTLLAGDAGRDRQKQRVEFT
jgi:hypothetical protein